MEMTNRFGLIVKWALYALVVIAAAVLQRYVFSRLAIFHITPLLFGALAVAVGMFEGAAAGAIFGGVMGGMMYAAPGISELLYALVYAVGGFATGVLCENLLRKNLANALLASLITNAVACLLFFVLVMWIPGRAGLYALLRTGIPEVAYSTALTPLLYAPVRLLYRAYGGADD